MLALPSSLELHLAVGVGGLSHSLSVYKHGKLRWTELSLGKAENEGQLILNRPTLVTPGVTASVKPVFVLRWGSQGGSWPRWFVQVWDQAETRQGQEAEVLVGHISKNTGIWRGKWFVGNRWGEMMLTSLGNGQRLRARKPQQPWAEDGRERLNGHHN